MSGTENFEGDLVNILNGINMFIITAIKLISSIIFLRYLFLTIKIVCKIPSYIHDHFRQFALNSIPSIKTNRLIELQSG